MSTHEIPLKLSVLSVICENHMYDLEVVVIRARVKVIHIDLW